MLYHIISIFLKKRIFGDLLWKAQGYENSESLFYQISKTYCEGRKILQLLRKRITKLCPFLKRWFRLLPFQKCQLREKAKHAECRFWHFWLKYFQLNTIKATLQNCHLVGSRSIIFYQRCQKRKVKRKTKLGRMFRQPRLRKLEKWTKKGKMKMGWNAAE